MTIGLVFLISDDAISPEPLRELDQWLERYRQLWVDRFDGLDQVIETLHRKERTHGRRKK